MARPPARDDEQGVDPDVIPGAHEARAKALGSDRDAAQAVGIERECGRRFACTRLYLDERERMAAARDDIDFAARHSGAAREDAPAVDAQIPAGEGLGAAAAPFGRLAAHLDRSRARA